jgi:hypothetical protein
MNNDSCLETIAAEQIFFQEKCEPATLDDGNKVLYSRTTDTRWKITTPLESAQLANYFQHTGHTLTIAYNDLRNYVRYAAWDIDCLCRKIPDAETHVTIEDVMSICGKIKDIVKSVCDCELIKISIWHLRCGFHIYTDCAVSLPVHVRLTQILEAACSLYTHVKIECPTLMPLPFSAKDSKIPYTYVRGEESIPLLVLPESPFVESVSYEEKAAGEIEGVLQAQTFLTFNRPPQGIVTLIASERNVETLCKDICLRINFTYRHSVISEKLNLFLLKFTTDFNVSSFAELAARENNGFMLQHYIVLLYKHLCPISINDFKDILWELLKEDLSDCRVIRHIEYFHPATANAYRDHVNDMYDTLLFYRKCGLTETMTIENVVTTCVEKSLGVDGIQKLVREKKISKLLVYYINALIRLKICVFQASTETWYMLQKEGYYKAPHKNRPIRIEYLPCIAQWVDHDANTLKQLYSLMTTKRDLFKVTDMWCLGEFMFLTKVGVFNSITSQYSAKTPLLRFDKHRNYALWDIGKPLQMYADQNKDILSILKRVMTLIKNITLTSTELFFRFLFIPAIRQLNDAFNMEEQTIRLFWSRLIVHEDVSVALCLVEEINLPIEYIYAILVFLYKFGESTILSYSCLTQAVFGHDIIDLESVSSDMWIEKLTFIQDMTYDKTKSTQLARLQSIKSPEIQYPTAKYCFYSVILGVCVAKCWSYNSLIKAFKINGGDNLLNVSSSSSSLSRTYYGASKEQSKKDMEIAKINTFGKTTGLETNLVDMIFRINMSSCFNPKTVFELTKILAASFVPYNFNKKLYLLYGRKDTGKSYFCKLLQLLNSPDVASVSNLADAIERANINLKANILIINEVCEVKAPQLKSITGNDAESAKIFFQQEYERYETQALVYGATNNVIQFENKKRDIDRVSVDRIHAVHLDGQQIEESEHKKDDLFFMVAKGRFFSNMTDVSFPIAANALSWIIYAIYLQTRNEDYRPTINVKHEFSVHYKNMVYDINNELYSLLLRCGFCDCEGFSVRSSMLKSHVRRQLEDGKGAYSSIRDILTFYDVFRSQYGIDLNVTTHVSDIARISLLNHIQENMKTVCREGGKITQQMVQDRTVVYADPLDQENAIAFFKQKNKDNYNYEKRVYYDIEFAKLELTSYEGNETRTHEEILSSSSSSSKRRRVAIRERKTVYDLV